MVAGREYGLSVSSHEGSGGGGGGGGAGKTWRDKWSGFLKTMRVARSDEKDAELRSTRYIFSLMLRLYAHKPVVHELEELYASQPERLIMYIPQLVAFALHGTRDACSAEDLETTEALHAFLRDKCEHSLRFAQRLFWFVRSFSPAEVGSALAVESQKRALVACGALRNEGMFTRRMALHQASFSSLSGATEEPPTRPLPRLAAGPPQVIGLSDFQWSVAFFDELTNMGGLLKEVEEPQRNKLLRATLKQLVDDYIPSDVMFMPVGQRAARIVGVQPNESFCFKTNSRVPFLVCFEIVAEGPALEADMEEHPSLEQQRRRRQREPGLELGGEGGEEGGGGGGGVRALIKGLARQLSTVSSDSQGKSVREVMMRSFTSGEASAPGLGASASAAVRDVSESLSSAASARDGDAPEAGGADAALGQWTPREPLKGRGAGFSHFQFHKDFEFEAVREAARVKLLNQHQSSGGGTEAGLGVAYAAGPRATAEGFTEVPLAAEDGFSPSSPPDGVADPMLVNARVASRSRAGSAAATLRSAGGSLERYHAAGDSEVPVVEEEAEEEEEEEEDEEEDEEEEEEYADAAPPSAGEEGQQAEDGPGEAEQEDAQEAKDREQGVIFRERWAAKEERVAKNSKFSHVKGWRLLPVIVKSGDDLRQEQFAAQMIKLFHSIFTEEGLPLFLQPYDVLAVSPDCGLIECVADTISLDSLKKSDPFYVNLRDFYVRFFGKPKTEAFRRARDNFCESLAAYCVVTYLLQIRDRHNGNILIKADGHLIHIDFGFLLSSMGPGNMNFERDPFKLTAEFVQLLGGPDSATFRKFRSLCCKAFLAARKRREQFVLMIEMMLNGGVHDLPCFQQGGQETIRQLNARFRPDLSRSAIVSHVNDLIDASIGSWRSRWYDIYQQWAVGISM